MENPNQHLPDDRTVAAQLRKPTGELGHKVGEKMNETNLYITELAYDLLEVQPTDHVLEIGFGNGRLMRILAERLTNGRLCGIDYSEDMVAEATEINADLIQSDRIKLREASIASIPFPDDSFDKVCTMNTIYFWESPAQALIEVRRVLRPGGSLVIGLRTRAIMERKSMFNYGFRLYEYEDVEHLLREAGFEEIAKVHRMEPEGEFDALVVRATHYK